MAVGWTQYAEAGRYYKKSFKGIFETGRIFLKVFLKGHHRYENLANNDGYDLKPCANGNIY